MRPLVGHCRLGLGRLAARTGRRADAESHLLAAIEVFQALGMNRWAERSWAARQAGDGS